VNAAVYGDDFDLGQIARGAALEAAAGAPMIATSAFAPDQATHAQPSRAEAADSLPQDPDSMPTTIGGRQSLITPTAAEAAQIATMRPGYTEAALATAPRSMLDIAVSAGRASDPASPSPISDPPSPNEAGVTDGSSTNAQPGSPASNVLGDAGSTPAAGATPQPTASAATPPGSPTAASVTPDPEVDDSGELNVSEAAAGASVINAGAAAEMADESTPPITAAPVLPEPTEAEQARRFLEETGWQAANARLAEAFKATVQPARAAADAAQVRRAEIEDQLPPGWSTVELPSEPGYERYRWKAVKDEHGNDVAWPLSQGEYLERAWREYGQEKRPDAAEDPVYRGLKARADQLRKVSDAAHEAWRSIGEHPRTGEWDAASAAEQLAAVKRRAAATKGRRTRADKAPRLQFSKSQQREMIDMPTAKKRIRGKHYIGRVELGQVTAKAGKLTRDATGIDTTGTRVNLRLDQWKHADDQHGSGSSVEKEMSKHPHQIPLEESDLDLLAPTVLDADAVGFMLDKDALQHAAENPGWIPPKERFFTVNVKQVGDVMIVAASLPNRNGVSHVTTAYKRKVRPGIQASDVLQEILQAHAVSARRAQAQQETAALWQKRQAADAPRVQSSTASKPLRPTPKSVTDALTLLKDRLTGLQNNRVLTFANAAEFLASGYAREGTFTAEETAGMQDAEAFYDNLTGHTIVFTGQITLREGEPPIRAVARVLLHERVGHDGLNTLLAQDARAASRWSQLAAQIPAAELDAIAAEAGYTHLATDRAQLALEWLARQVESVEGARNAAAIERSLTGAARQLWQALKEMLAKVFANFSREAAFAHEAHEIITLARDAAFNGTADPTTPEGLVGRVQFSQTSANPAQSSPTPDLLFESVPPNSQSHDQRADIDAYNASLREDARRAGVSPAVVEARQLQLGNVRGGGSAALAGFGDALRSTFGKRIVFVQAVRGVVPDGGAIRSRSNALFLNAERKQPVMYLAGHEFGHSLEHQAPQLYQELKAAVLASAGDWSV